VTESSRSTDAPLSRALALARPALAERPGGLLTDFDGTLSPIVADPALARLVDGAEAALATLATRLDVVAVVTGRAPLDARAMTGVPGLLIAGNHGTEWLEPGASEPVADPATASVRSRLDGLLARLPELPGVAIEHKGLSATVHYRNARDPAAARGAIVAALDGTDAAGVELRHGRMSVELRPVNLGDKGSATRAIIERFALRGAVVMGDDVTDLDMFGAVADLRAAGRLHGVIIGVGGGDHEVPAAVAEASDALLADPAEAAAFLGALAGDAAAG
jgi:trehalose 6-phosphate phosphatase